MVHGDQQYMLSRRGSVQTYPQQGTMLKIEWTAIVFRHLPQEVTGLHVGERQFLGILDDLVGLPMDSGKRRAQRGMPIQQCLKRFGHQVHVDDRWNA